MIGNTTTQRIAPPWQSGREFQIAASPALAKGETAMSDIRSPLLALRARGILKFGHGTARTRILANSATVFGGER